VSDFDIRHNFRTSAVYEVPRMSGQNFFLREVVGGWSLSVILDRRSGFPFNLTSGRDNSFSGMGLDRADLKRNPSLDTGREKQDLILKYFDTSLVTTNAVGTFGNAPRNFMRGLGAFNVDSSLMKDFTLKEQLKLQLRGEFFNLLNHANLGTPGTNVSSATNFGRINSADSPRILQVGVRLSF
jgi:hypothetical protein